MFTERRNFVRAKRVLSIEYRLSKRNSKNMSSAWQLSTTHDMSLGGLTFFSEYEFRANDVIELNVLMSGLLDIFKGFGKVVRVDKKRSAAFYLVAVKLLKKEPGSRSAKSYITASKNRIKSKNQRIK